MFFNKCQTKKSPICCTDIIKGALVTAGVVAVGRFVWCKLKKKSPKLAHDMCSCKDDMIAFARDAAEEVCECISDEGVGGCDCS